MYYSLPPFQDGRAGDGWRIGIAASTDLDTWQPIGEVPPLSPCDRNGLCAPGAIVLGSQVHLPTPLLVPDGAERSGAMRKGC
jgi:hypothetical protein